ncbi:c-type cytochrome [Pistricoccus aurantiacus]|uniref:c-type cytochrome n=1 Tax=Pistricoccus aurantiacus TaxID=1883414 RepID=UPI00363C3269
MGSRPGKRHSYLIILLLIFTLFTTPFASAEPASERQKELETLLYQDCGSCHGMTLRGGLGPSLLPEALARYNLDAITGIILHGVPGTAMPPWSDLLTEDDAAWLADHLLSVKPASP